MYQYQLDSAIFCPLTDRVVQWQNITHLNLFIGYQFGVYFQAQMVVPYVFNQFKV